MCRTCYIEFMKSTGGMYADGADPPAFKKAKKKEAALLALKYACELGFFFFSFLPFLYYDVLL